MSRPRIHHQPAAAQGQKHRLVFGDGQGIHAAEALQPFPFRLAGLALLLLVLLQPARVEPLRAEHRDKVTLVLSEKIRALGPWIEQLLAESLGKDDTGLVPVVAAPFSRFV